MIFSSTSPYGRLKEFQLLVAYETISFFVVVPIISEQHCSTESLNPCDLKNYKVKNDNTNSAFQRIRFMKGRISIA